MKNAETAAERIGIKVSVVEARNATELEQVLKDLGKLAVDGVFVAADGMLMSERVRIADAALKARLPTSFDSRLPVESGGLMSYGTDYPQMVRHAAAYVERVLKGAKPGDLPIDQPSRYELIINLKTAKVLGLRIPPSLLLRADQVIE